MNDPITTDACLIRDTFDIKVKEVINKVIDMKGESPFSELLENDNMEKASVQSAEIGRIGAYQVIIMFLKAKLLDDYSLSEEKYDV